MTRRYPSPKARKMLNAIEKRLLEYAAGNAVLRDFQGHGETAKEYYNGRVLAYYRAVDVVRQAMKGLIP